MLFVASSIARAAALLLLVKIPLRLPTFGREKKTPALCPALVPPMAANRPHLKPSASSPRMHSAHPTVPKPAFLRVSSPGSSEKDAKRNVDANVTQGKRI
jgi:hypothetical protein